ncbi:OmpP1/FadL family transporter [Sandaracinobacteroides hominis]|uniref:OmpP1/FadL family transporter n=1 Tax=Sandaracinobacteroides hominis TaxID=2780086 RepID=UPI0018F295E5|nr:outer membrane protein transport protein [Sandaracinobacteroides hominis]
MYRPFKGAFAAAIVASVLIVAPAHASGFALRETSPGALGRAFAGDAAMADSASIVWANPAGMTRLDKFTVTGGAHLLFVNSGQTDTGTTRTIPGVPTAVPTGGGNGGNPFDPVILIPTLYAVMPVSDRLSLGMGINAPFGLKVEYDDGWFGRYDSLRSELVTYNVQPSVAYRINDFLSVGAGLDIQYIEADLSNALPNLSPLQPDGFLRIKGDDVSVGWNLGVLADLETMRFGIHYRSRVKHTLDGSLQISGLLGPLAAQNSDRDGKAPITMPDSLTFSAMVSPAEGWRILGSAEWVNWSVFDAIRVNVDGQTAVTSPQNYKDSWSFSLGGAHDFSDKVTARVGIAMDATPTTDMFRSTRVPDGDRTWLTTGLSWHASDSIEVRASYAHVFVTAENLDRADGFFEGTPAAIESHIRSRNTGNVNMIGADVTFHF